jgi:hypothetical protein
MQLASLRRTADDLRRALDGLDPARLTGGDALALLEAFTTIEKLAAGGRLLVAPRVEATNVWRRDGHRSAAAHLAETSGTPLGSAIDTLEAGRRLGSMPATDAAVREGRLSEAQVKEIAGADAARPGAEAELVDVAEHQALSVLKLRCRRVRAESRGHGDAYRAIHRSRSLRSWTEPGGAVRFDARLTPDQGARLLAAVKREADRRAREASRAGSRESRRALEADAVVALACRGDGRTRSGGGERGESSGGESTPTAVVSVRVDHDALLRGHVEAGEVCEIPGVGPIPVEVARQLAVDSYLSVLVTRGVDVTTVAHAGRTVPTALRRALAERDPACVVPGCAARDDLEIDHVRPYHEGGRTSLDNLARLCPWHHYLKTHRRFTLVRTGDGWDFRPPPGPDPPLAA